MLRIVGVSLLVALTGAVTPGPLLALVVAQVVVSGLGAVWPILLGHALLEGVFVLLLAVGTVQALSRPVIRGTLAVFGGLVLAVMAWMMIRDASGMTLNAIESDGLSWWARVAAGVGVSLANPYFSGWWATVGTGQFAALQLNRRRDLIAFYCGHEMGDAIWYVFVGMVLVSGRAWLTDEIYRIVILICGLCLGLLAFFFVLLGVREWIKVNADRPQAAADRTVHS